MSSVRSNRYIIDMGFDCGSRITFELFFFFVIANSPLVSQSNPPLETGLHTPWQWDVEQTGAKVCRQKIEPIVSIFLAF